MVYSSLLFIYGFLPISLLLFYVTPKKMRELVLLILSMVFCGMMSLYFLIFMILYTAVNFGFAHIIGKVRKKTKSLLLCRLPAVSYLILWQYSFSGRDTLTGYRE